MRIKPFVIAAALAMSTALTGCMTDGFLYSANYGATTDSGYSLPAVPITKVPQQFRRTIIDLDTPEKPGTIIVDTGSLRYRRRPRRF
jgi:lipoprotein-anchoring transpeptidase ErfK/SrfK